MLFRSQLLSTRFAGEEKNYAGYIAVLHALGVAEGARMLDFGCSWGYGSWQLAQAGFAVEAFEISRSCLRLRWPVHEPLPKMTS